MSKVKRLFICQACQTSAHQWAGQCSHCNRWNTLVETSAPTPQHKHTTHLSRFIPLHEQTQNPIRLPDVIVHANRRFPTGSTELDRVLGGGLVEGSIILLGGDPGIGKSTLLLQTLCHLSNTKESLYITGEESLQQITLRAERLGLSKSTLYVLAETHVERMCKVISEKKPTAIVIDSIQTAYTDLSKSAPGSLSQVRESASQLVQFAKRTGIILFLVGHVTKEGSLAGPRVLEHMVDTVLYFEGERDSRWRLIRSVKNRFGAVNELGIFAMADKGLREVSNPSSIFLSAGGQVVPGCVVMPTWGGSRPLLVEVQSLVDESHLANPRRIALGLDGNRLNMLLAVLHRHGNRATHNRDIFVNVVGGLRITETAADLALLAAIVSSLHNQALPKDTIILGEVGLAGEIRPVQYGQERLREAAKHGFKRAIIPKANQPSPSQPISGMTICPVQHISEALKKLLETVTHC